MHLTSIKGVKGVMWKRLQNYSPSRGGIWGKRGAFNLPMRARCEHHTATRPAYLRLPLRGKKRGRPAALAVQTLPITEPECTVSHE